MESKTFSFRWFFNLALLFLTSNLLSISCKKGNEPNLPDKPLPPVVIKKLATADSVILLQELPGGQKEAQRLAQNFRASDFSPTGFYLPPGGTVTLNLSFIKGAHSPVLLVGTYSRYQDKWNPSSYTLNAGNNTITDATGGILYIRFVNDEPDSQVQIKFISGFKPIPFFQSGKTTAAEWSAMLDSIKDVPDVQLVGKKTMITHSYSNAIKYQTDDRQALVDLADRVIILEDSISGLFGADPLDQPNVHRYLLTESDHPDYYMAATWYRTWYRTTDAVSAILSANNLTWGPWHELGHMHQQGSWTWSELTEVTVNIYSLAVQKALGLSSRLKADNTWGETQKYLAKPDSEKNFNASSVSVWVKLCLFQQLKLAFGEPFYHQLHRAARREMNRPTTTDGKIKWFLLQSSKISGKDLSGFFKKWGLQLSTPTLTDAAYSELAALKLPVPDTDITNLTD